VRNSRFRASAAVLPAFDRRHIDIASCFHAPRTCFHIISWLRIQRPANPDIVCRLDQGWVG
jgi:hypothetical protein